MPGFDKTGPGGQGPMTGRGQGSCVDSTGKPGMGMGRRRGFGMGRGLGRFFNWTRPQVKEEPENK